MPDGSVLIAGGWDEHARPVATAELFNPQTGKFGPAASLSGPRAGHLATVLRDGRVLITGGASRGDHRIATTEFFEPSTGAFVAGPSMHQARFKHHGTSNVLADGSVLVLGGAARAERYVPAGNRFETIGSLDLRHAESFAASAQGFAGVILLAGGYDDDIRASATAWLISPLRSQP